MYQKYSDKFVSSLFDTGTTSPAHAGSSSVGSGQQPVATVATVSGSGQTQSQGQQPVIKHQFITSPVTSSSSHGALLAPIKPYVFFFLSFSLLLLSFCYFFLLSVTFFFLFHFLLLSYFSLFFLFLFFLLYLFPFFFILFL